MSVFQSATASCPTCNSAMNFAVVASVNADRRPDIRAEILAGTFQRQQCASCGATFRVPPLLTYIDVGRHQWILVLPASRVEAWPALEQQATATFERAYGADAPELAQEIGRTLAVRIVFGWAALAEKILCAERGLDDVTLELLKLAILRSSENSPLSDTNEMRLLAVADDTLDLAWITAATGARLATLTVPKSIYDDIAGEAADWQALRSTLAASPFVDYTRLLVGAA